MAFLRVLVRIGVVPKPSNIVGHFLEKHDLKFDRCCRRRALSVLRPIDPPWSSYLWGQSSLVRQHAYPCRKNTPAQPAFPYIFPSALRAAGRTMEAAPTSWARHSDTVNMLFKLRSSSVFGTRRGRQAGPRLLLEGRRRWRLRLAMGGCIQILVAHEGIRRAVRLAMRMPAAPCRPRIAQPRSLDSMLMKCILAPTSARFATDLAVLYGLLCSCARVPFGRCR